MRQIKSLVGVLIVVAGMYLAWKVFPIYYANFEFQDFVDEQARIESYSNHTEPEIAEVMAKKARDLDIPLTADQVKVQKQGTDLTINTEYTVRVDVPVYPFDLHFNVGTKNHRI